MSSLKEIASSGAQEKEGMLSYESLTPDTVLYWYMLSKHIKDLGHEYEEMLEQLLPEMSTFCEYIQG